MSAAGAERMGQTSRQAARAQVRKSWPLRSLERLRGALAQTGLRAVALPLRARSHSDSPCSPNTQSGATVGGVRAVALAPNSGANYLLKFTRRATGARRPRSSSEVRAHRPRPPSLARSDPARVLGRSRARAPPPARVSPSPRPRRPSLAHLTPPRTCPARRPRCVSARWALVLVGRASEDYLKGSSGRAVNELVGPRVPRATAHPRALPAGAGVGATRGRGDADAAAETPAAAVDSAAAVPSIATAIAAAVAAVAVAFRSPPRRPRRPRLPRHAPRRLPLSTAVVAATDARVRRRRRRCRPHCPQRRRRRRRRCRRRRSGIQGVGGSPPGR